MLSNNDILKKLRVAYTLKTDDIGQYLRAGGIGVSNSEVTAFLRPVNDAKKRYRPIKDEVLKVFLVELLNSGQVSPEEYPTLKAMADAKSCGNLVDNGVGEWLDNLIEKKRGKQ